MSALHALICWMTCTHTSYSITLVHTVELVPSPLGKVHMILDTLGHGAGFILLDDKVAGAIFVWHAVKYFWKSFKVK